MNLSKTLVFSAAAGMLILTGVTGNSLAETWGKHPQDQNAAAETKYMRPLENQTPWRASDGFVSAKLPGGDRFQIL